MTNKSFNWPLLYLALIALALCAAMWFSVIWAVHKIQDANAISPNTELPMM